MNKIFRWLQREAVPPQHRDLYDAIHKLEERLNARTKENEEQLAVVRSQRDQVQDELNLLEEWFNVISRAFEQDIPSVTEQSKCWKCKMIDFGKANRQGVAYFNPGIVERPDGLWLVVRRCKDWPRFEYGLNDLMAFRLEGPEHLPVTGVKVQIPPMLNGEHFEDPRVIYRDGFTWLSCCNFVVYADKPIQKWTGAHQLFCQVNDAWNCLKRYDPIYGGNGGSTSLNKRDEKNWLWFFHDDLPHLIYLTQPHTVVPFNSFMEAGTPYVTQEINKLWMHGMPRGGTPPVLVEGEYWSFFHSSTPWVGKKRRYHMGAYAFEAKPPFRITRMSSLPLLSGSKRDKWNEGKPLVVFPGGAVLKNGTWLVVFGVNDLVAGWIEIPHADLLHIVKDVPPIVNNHEKSDVICPTTTN